MSLHLLSLGGRLDGRLVLLTLPLPPPLALFFLGWALGLALDEGRDGVDVGVERPLPLVDCFDVGSDLLVEGLVQEESERPSAPHRRHFPVVRGVLVMAIVPKLATVSREEEFAHFGLHRRLASTFSKSHCVGGDNGS